MVYKSKITEFTNTYDINNVDYHNLIETFFKNSTYLYQNESNVENTFPILTQEVVVPKIFTKLTEKNPKELLVPKCYVVYIYIL